MQARTIVDVWSALSNAEFDAIIGCEEGLELDFKSEPYALDEADRKQEFTKDVAAFANSSGGVIVVGVRTDKDPRTSVEVAAEIRAVPIDRINVDRHRDAVRDQIVPEVRGLQVRWFPLRSDEKRGLLAVRVPPQDKQAGPFLVRFAPNARGERKQFFGLPVRDGDRVTWTS